MSKTETLRQSAAALNATRVEHLASQIESLRQAKAQSAEELAQTLEPLAQAMAALADETRQTLAEIDRKSREQGETFKRQLAESVKGYRQAAADASQAAESLNQAASRMEWRHAGTIQAAAPPVARITAGWPISAANRSIMPSSISAAANTTPLCMLSVVLRPMAHCGA